jgi:hypothetical protein
MPKNSPFQRKLVLNRETVRALTKSQGAAFVTTQGPTVVYTYCNGDCGSRDCEPSYPCSVDC